MTEPANSLMKSVRVADYPERIEELLRALSIIEQRPAAEIIRNIVTPTCDIVHLRLESEETRTGTVELGFVEHFFASVRNLLVFAACGELRPRPFYQRALGEAVRFADRCRLRPAPAASFKVDVETPLVPPAHDAQVQLKAFPIERRILLSLMDALGVLQQSVDTGKTDAIFTKNAGVLNANVCDSLLGMRPGSTGARLEVSVSWSSSWPVDGRTSLRLVAFEGKAFERIDAIGRALRAGNEPQERHLYGRVIRLSAQDPIHAEAGPLVVVLHVESANAPHHVEVALTPAQYRAACEAHMRAGRVSVRGTLDRIGRKWRLIDAVDFRAVSDTADSPR